MQANGHAPAPEQAEPKAFVARGLYEAQMEDGDPGFDDLSDGEREALIDYAATAIGLHAQWLSRNGFRVAPPNTFAAPQSREEAQAMAQAAKAFLADHSHKGALLATPARKLILPPGMH